MMVWDYEEIGRKQKSMKAWEKNEIEPTEERQGAQGG